VRWVVNYWFNCFSIIINVPSCILFFPGNNDVRVNTISQYVNIVSMHGLFFIGHVLLPSVVSILEYVIIHSRVC
jgi:hypothetical protein